MKSFSEQGVTSKRSFVGNKIYIESILEKHIIIEFFDIRPSRKNDGTDCLHMQIKLDQVDHVVFSSSTFLMNQLKQLKDDDFPFTAKIVKINRHYEFK
jgi:hypothetical protein